MFLKIRDAILSGLFVILIVFLVILALGVKDFPLSYNNTSIDQKPDNTKNAIQEPSDL